MPVAFGPANKLTLRLSPAPKIVVRLGSTPQGPAGPPGNSEPIPPYTLLGNDVATSENPQGLTISQVKSMLGYVSGADLLSALGAYTPTANLAAVALSGNAADLFGTLPNSRLSGQVVRNDFSYADPAWINSLNASKLTGTIADARLGSNVVLRNISNVFTTGNTFQASQVFDASIVLGGLTGPRIRNVGQVFRLNTNDDTARAGLEVGDITSTGLLGIGMAPQTWRSITILPVNTGDRSGIRINDYGSFASAVNQSAFEVAYLGGTPTAPSSPVAGHYRNLLVFRTGGTNGLLSSSPGFAIRSVIGAVIGSFLSVVDTSFVVTPTGTGVPIFAQTIYGNTGLVDFPVGTIQLGTSVRLKNNAGVLEVRNSGDSDFAPVRADYFRFKNGSYLVSDATYNYSVDSLDAVKAFRAKTFTASAGDMFISVFGDRIVSSTSAQAWTFLTSANASLGIKIGSLVVSDSYADNAPTNGLFVKGNSSLAGYLTSAFQTLAADPSTSDLSAGLARLVKNTTTGEIGEWANDGGTMRKLSSTLGAFSFRVDGGGAVPATGPKKFMFRVPYKCILTGWEVVADISGSVVVDVWKNATYPPVNADSIVASAKPTLSSALQASSTTLTGWTTLLNAGDYIEIEVESAATLTAFALTLTVTRA